MKLNIILRNSCFAAAVAAMGFLTGCQPEEVSGGNALFNENVDATFTVTPTDASGNRYKLEGVTGAGQLVHRWDTGTGEFKGDSAEELFLPDAGTYTVTHTVYGNGGMSNSSTQTITVTTPDPIAGNLILNGKFDDGAANWGVFNTSGTETVTWSFANGKATASGGVANVWTGQGIYQAVDVTPGTYKINMHVSGPGGNDQMWFQVFLGANQPVNGSDYGSDPLTLIGLNTWAGCGIAPFDGMLATISCQGSGNTVTVTQAGTMYLVVKAGTGSNNGIVGVSVDNVEMRRMN
ncbi:hypothetical protein [Flavobacterium sp.]|uniref:hypothetical protein n=1 Tax=Flavobacterium sp. TaxID=239 RepID=UPI0040340F4A